MTKHLLATLLFSVVFAGAHGQITTPQTKANFGVDAELRSNYFSSFVQSGDDWFSQGDAGTGTFIIDTTGASYILSQYTSNPSSRMQPFFRGMRFDQFSIVNNRMLIDGIFIRDHHGDDSTVFAAGSNKNGMSPASWSCPVSQGIPDKTDILDIMMHVRRAGPNPSDSMWMFGGVSIENTTGNRYFDFEMYQTDIVYDQSVRQFFGYGPDAGHTSWKFDASGNIISPGDIIFTAEYGSSSLSNLEARIWVNVADLSLTPTAFSWGGSFDGASAGATYGYASIVPKTAGDFYTGLQSASNTWAGSFSLVRQNNTVVTNYTARQYMEFSVNLSKLGLDPLVTNGDACGLPFRRILVKSRASTSFTAELKDFVGPFAFFRAPRAQASADIPLYCGSIGVSEISVTNPVSTSLYKWTTPDGHIVGDSIGTSITADAPGMYIVNQQLMDSCGLTYASDTVNIVYDPDCVLLDNSVQGFKGSMHNRVATLEWLAGQNNGAQFILERSFDGNKFTIAKQANYQASGQYKELDNVPDIQADAVYYRLKIKHPDGKVTYSQTIRLPLNSQGNATFRIAPNPARDFVNISLNTDEAGPVDVYMFSASGVVVKRAKYSVQQGLNTINLAGLDGFANGTYFIQVIQGSHVYREKMVLMRQ